MLSVIYSSRVARVTTVTVRPKTRNVLSNTEIVRSTPTESMDVYVCLVCVCVVLCVSS
jgi:hypothetical protein